jgi:ABC-type phosphate transport system permease subunit
MQRIAAADRRAGGDAANRVKMRGARSTMQSPTQQRTEFQLTPAQGNSLVLRILAALALCALAFSWGQYGIAPGGHYTFSGEEAQSFDPATYRWFFQDSFGVESMVIDGTLVGIFNLLIAVPIGLLAAFALSRSPRLAPLARGLVNLDIRWSLLLLCGSWLAGLGLTIHNGLNPGICC